jgi:hypothetical protein
MDTDGSTRVASLTQRLANVEVCLAEARAADVRAFLEEIRAELRAELSRLSATAAPGGVNRRAELHLVNVVPIFASRAETSDRCA